MPRGTGRYDEARLQSRLWVSPNLGNHILQSDAIGASPWQSFTTSTATITPTLNAGIAPNGTNTATLVSMNRASNGDYAELYQVLGSAPGGAYSHQLWLKAYTSADVGKSVGVGLYDGISVTANIILLTAAWTRYPVSATLAAGSPQVILGYFAGIPLTTGSVQYLAWRALAGPLATIKQDCPTTTTAIPFPGVATNQAKDEAIDLWRYGLQSQLASTSPYLLNPPLIGA